MHVAHARICLIAVHGVSSYDVTGAQRPLESNEVIHKAINNHQYPDHSTTDDDRRETVYVIEFESESNEKDESLQTKANDASNGEHTADRLNPLPLDERNRKGGIQFPRKSHNLREKQLRRSPGCACEGHRRASLHARGSPLAKPILSRTNLPIGDKYPTVSIQFR